VTEETTVSDEYPACIRELYESEIFGEAVFAALVPRAKSARDAYHLGTLLQLETETKARLRPFLFRHGVPLDETMDLAAVELAVAGYDALPWPEFMAANLPVVQDFLARFEQIVALGPDDDRAVLESMVRHERAILRWATAEADGPRDDSLADVVAELQYPLPVSPSAGGA
jgi:hypothetical protein